MVSVCLPSDALLQHLPSYMGFSYLGHGVSLHGYSSKAQPLLLTLDEGFLLTASLPDLQCAHYDWCTKHGREELFCVRGQGWRLEELPHARGQGRRPGGPTLCPRIVAEQAQEGLEELS